LRTSKQSGNQALDSSIGRSPITKETCRVLGCGPEAVDIVFEDVKKENWATAGKLWSDEAKPAPPPAG
jgi:hypothetical protein